MTAASFDVIFDALAGASIAGAVVALGVWALSAAAGRLPAAVRCTVWWLVSLKLLLGLASIEPVAVPILPPSMAVTSTLSTSAAVTHAVTPLAESQAAVTFTWRAALIVIWLGGLAVAAVLAIGQWRRVWSIRARARAADAGLARQVRELSRRSGLSAPPRVRFSSEIDAPMVTGLIRPVVVLPSGRWASLTAEQQQMAICHELVHVRRRDLWLGLVPSLAERLFFFHPLAHLAAREYVITREAACDAAVLRVLDAEPRDYGRLLVTLGVAPLPGGVSASGAPHSFSSLKRRIGMLNLGAPTLAHRLAGWTLSAIALGALLPLELVARPATALVAEQEAGAPTTATTLTKRNSTRSGFEYMLVLGDNEGTFEAGNFERQRQRRDEPGLWFKLGGQTYEVRDPASIDQAAAIVKPVAEIGRQQGEIGAKQGLIGAQQGIVGAKQGEVGARQGAIGAQQGLLGARQGVLGARQAADLTDAEKEQIQKEQQKIDREMHELNAKMAALDKEMREVSASMPDLSVDMEKLSKQMDVLSGKMADASAKADAQMRELAEKLIKLGKAKTIN
jgi:bla regulator protein blaR1